MSDHFRAKKYDVFVSYKREDFLARDVLIKALEAKGYEVFWDAKLNNDEFQVELRDEIERCKIVIVLWSELASKSDNVKAEAFGAYQLEKLLSAPIEGFEKVPEYFKRVNLHPFHDWADETARQVQLDKILATVERVTGGPSIQQKPAFAPAIDVHLGEIPPAPPKLVGREAELDMLSKAWHGEQVNTVVLHALGGAGKSALLRAFVDERLATNGGDGAARIYGWSAYSQGSGTQKRADADGFISQALKDFGYPGELPNDSVERARELAKLIQKERVLLLLDGLEPLQDLPGVNKGRLKDKGLGKLIQSLSLSNPGLLVITTRQPIVELENHNAALVINHPLDRLSPQAGADLLEELGVTGRQQAFEKAVKSVDGHALSVTLLGTYLTQVHGGDIRKQDLFDFHIRLTPEEEARAEFDETLIPAKRAQKVMRGYLEQFEGQPERALLHLLGLFDRPADGGAVEVLLSEPIDGLTDDLFFRTDASGKEGGSKPLSPEEREDRLWWAKERLRKLRLLASESKEDSNGLDAHPVVRAYFAERLMETAPEAAKIAHDRLYRHYTARAPDLPDTLEDMQPLFHAIAHGVAAGHVQEACDEVFFRRIERGNDQFIKRVLGAFGPELAVLAHFFDPPWTTPHPDLRPGNQAWVLGSAAFALTSLGRLAESVDPRRASLEMRVNSKLWKNAAIAGGMLCETLLTLGRVSEALPVAQTALEHAKKSGDKQRIEFNHGYLANAQLAAGALDDSLASFLQAEKLQAEHRPDLEGLVSFQGYRYGDLLLARGETDDALRRGHYQLDLATRGLGQGMGLHNIGLAHLLIGRAQHALNLPEANTSLNAAVNGLRNAGVEQLLPQALLARAAWYRDQAAAGDATAIAKAHQDLEEVAEIAGEEMEFYLVDLALERARLALDVSTALTTARTHTDTAADLIAKTGYHRRDGELAELQTRLAKL